MVKYFMIRFHIRCAVIISLLTLCFVQAYSIDRAKHAMVVSGSMKASEAGVQILQQGGNAIDAAVAVGYTLAVVFPEAGNIGGGGFALVRMKNGASMVVDFRETAPGHATRDMYLDKTGKPNGKSVDGDLAVAVPGTVAGFVKMFELGGKLRISDLLKPAIKFAQEGFVVDRHLADNLKAYKESLVKFPSTAALYFPGGVMLKEGDTLRQPDLAATLQRIAEQGADGFYKGATAAFISEEMKKNGGIINEQDLMNYRAVMRNPLVGSYRGYSIITVPPPSSGGVSLLQMLGMMEPFSFDASDFHSSRAVHLMAEAMKRAFADRYEFAADPDFIHVAVDTLISPKYIKSLQADVDSVRAIPAVKVKHGVVQEHEGNNTTHFVIADEEGNVVSVTYTLNDLFGNKVVVPGAGFFLNDEMDDFSTKPGEANMYGLPGTEKNSIAPGKRPVSSMTPTIVMKDHVPVLVLGARGGPRIVTSVFQAIMNVIDFKMNIDQAINTPRFHHQLFPDTLIYEPRSFSDDVLKDLRTRGFNLSPTETKVARMEALYRDPKTGWFFSGADRREDGGTAGY